MNSMPMMSPAMMALTTAAMMVAMMLPSIAPVLWRYRRHLRAAQATNADAQTMIVAAGYVTVWASVGLGLFAMSTALSPMGMPSMGPSVSRLTEGLVLLCVGAVQRSGWKANQLVRCRDACGRVRPNGHRVLAVWSDGCRLGIDCCLSCAAPMAFLFVAGLMDVRAMLAITVAITAERVAPSGQRIARWTGVLALVAGVLICVRAVGIP